MPLLTWLSASGRVFAMQPALLNSARCQREKLMSFKLQCYAMLALSLSPSNFHVVGYSEFPSAQRTTWSASSVFLHLLNLLRCWKAFLRAAVFQGKGFFVSVRWNKARFFLPDYLCSSELFHNLQLFFSCFVDINYVGSVNLNSFCSFCVVKNRLKWFLPSQLTGSIASYKKTVFLYVGLYENDQLYKMSSFYIQLQAWLTNSNLKVMIKYLVSVTLDKIICKMHIC